MGQKVNPIGLRIGIVEKWRGNWFAGKKEFSNLLKEDVAIRNYLIKRFPRGTISKIEIEKTDKLTIKIHTTRPGVILGRKGSEIDMVRDEIYSLFKKQVNIDVIEVNPPGISAQFLADSMAMQLEKRLPHRQVIKKTMALALQSGAQGIKIRISGRIGGTEIARSELYMEGKVPLHTLRARIDYAVSVAFLRSGTVGLKVWVYLGEVLEKEATGKNKETEDAVNA
ncbi:MAG: 30S ribosomal protein S3 [Candidatus Ratteibacteria bacterium]|nr:30S ribosomal protein S3 [Candidatus Ratteibacteria bacterium]